ncbi:F-box/kelch-repeat protein At3g06240-like [Cornus florida]|uniref:F-box/kelch-repeat protein At3g06240-like n=1 Tax=Cornus florida TaxID=4283 RepID=UPI002898F4D7|nr:F-box/kelch-repeat protein At3g06240-like [Cornus florida]XP_059639397.1 F-box/kelch-repeat protein At3g06240-like [Cornus florida]
MVLITPFFTIIGSFNGLVCLNEYTPSSTRDVLYLWNPSIGKFIVLPEPRITYCDRALGFGFNSTTNDYQVVRIAYVSSGLEVDMYSLKEGCWTRISVCGTIPCIRFDSSHTSLNGTLHWISEPGHRFPFIVFFNLGS